MIEIKKKAEIYKDCGEVKKDLTIVHFGSQQALVR